MLLSGTFLVSAGTSAAEYSSRFTNKWYSKLQLNYKEIAHDYELYPNEMERQVRWIYDGMCDEFRSDRSDTPKRLTQHVVETGLFVSDYYDYSSDGTYTFIDKKKGPTYTKEDIKRYVMDSEGNFYSYDAFLSKCKNSSSDWGYEYNWMVKRSDYMLKYSTSSFFPALNSQMKIIANKPFAKLSSAMKIYAIDKSGYFSHRSSRNGKYGMYYSNKSAGCTKKLSKKTRLKNLFLNKAKGVCMDYANYENTYFKSVGITSWYRSSDKINHAWTVVKVKNSRGKVLWVPFDYGIGPAEQLEVNKNQKKYISTEKKRYALYLKGLSGAPNYKNFSEDDFV